MRRLAKAKAKIVKHRSTIKALQKKLRIKTLSAGRKPKMGRISQMFFDNEIANYGHPPSGRRFTKEVKMLSMRLAYHSTSGFNEIRQQFTLPTTRTIRIELSPCGCDPGLLADALEHIKNEISAGKLEPNCSLMVDEMSIMQKACWDPAKKTIIGYANCWNSIDMMWQCGRPCSLSLFYVLC